MKNFLKNHMNTVLIVLVIVFLAIIVGYFIWGIGYVTSEVDKADDSQTATAQTFDFNLKAAAALDYRGLMN
jgi:hypothetical protein